MKNFRTEKELASSYDAVWNKFILREEAKYYTWIADLLHIDKGGRFLDIACGAGFMLKEAAKRCLRAYGIDISSTAIRMAQKEAPSSTLHIGSGEDIAFRDDFFDFITCLGSLEHYLNPERGVREIGRLLKKGGKACIALPNKWYWFDCLQGMTRGLSSNHGQEIERFYSKEGACPLLEDNGLKIVRVYGYNKKLSLRARFKLFEILYNNFLRHIVWSNASYSFVFICEKR